MKRTTDWPQILTPLAALACYLGMASAALSQTQTHPGDEVLLQMQQAARQGQASRLKELLPAAQGHPLQIWAEYWELSARLGSVGSSEVEQFLQRWPGTYLEDRLRNDWLLLLGQRRQWSAFTRLHPHFRMQDDKQVQCYDLAIASEQGRPPTDAGSRLQQLWLDQPNADEGCSYAAGQLHQARLLPTEVLWQRARLGAERKHQGAARKALTSLGEGMTAPLEAIFSAPQTYLSKTQAPTRASADGASTELATLALVRLAVLKPEQAVAQLQGAWGKALSPSQRDWVWGVVGKVAASRLLPQAVDYFGQVQSLPRLHTEHLAWLARAALRNGRWPLVEAAIEAMPASSRADSTWVYWHARALLAQRQHPQYTQRQASAQEALQRIAGVNGFYEQLAQEALGQPISAPPEPAPPTAQEIQRAKQHPGLSRALYAIGMGLRSEGVREWNYSTNLHEPGGMADRDLFAAAELACQAQVWDRCINTSERTRAIVSWRQRYPMPFAQDVIARARHIGLDPAYVYGLIRQESRFIMDARS
ncbi:MAG: lytic transglycosylase domain-containing protein, partial [Comamonas sp.]|nr:lytic transglycosylase domain-containing protein [Comamonas sp.]